ncbi:MAG: PAS domain-containing protein [Candidatus Lambdaproteobacteria bacterium]|nr:PAS domain-containing protein [Candidatus Lambdaproteobacteria bacterium]
MKDLNHLFGRIPIRTKLLILTLGLVIIPLVSFSGLTILLGLFELNAQALRLLESEARAIGGRINAYFSGIERDVRQLSRSPRLLEFVSRLDTPAEGRARKALERELASWAHANSSYYQLRFIDADGKERVRVDRRGEAVAVLPVQQLQDKSRRYYFQEAIRLSPGRIYVSPMDLNVEHEQVENPKVPVFRYAATTAMDGRVRGTFVVNVFGRTVLDVLRTNTAPAYENLTVLDAQGRIIVAGSERSGRLDLTLELERMAENGGRVPAQPLSLDTRWFFPPRGEFFVRLPIDPLGDGPSHNWSLVLQGDRSLFIRPIFDYAVYSLAFLLMIVLAAVGVGLLAARHFYRSILQLKEGARRVAGGRYDVALALDTNDELEDLAGDFTTMAQALQSHEQKLRLHQRDLERLVALRTSQITLEKEKLERVMDGVGAGLALFDQEARLVWYNERFDAMIRPVRCDLGSACCDILSIGFHYCAGDVAPGANCSIRRALAGEPVEMPLKAIAGPDGERRFFLDRVAPIRNGAGQVGHALHILDDVTEQQRREERERAMERQLMRAEKLATLGRFTAGIAHEIGNPLGIISTNAQTLQEQLPEDSAPWRQLELILAQIRRLSKITRDLHTFGKPSPPERVHHKPQDILSGLRPLIATEAAAKGLSVEWDTRPCTGHIYVDAQQAQQVILNLVVNAFEAMPEGGRLTLKVATDHARPEGPQAVFSVADTGIGIPAENLAFLFDPFFTTKPQGTGFGLGLAHSMVTQNGGQISVASRVGQGSTFTIAFPLVTESAVAEGTATTRPAPFHRSQP